MSTPPTTRPPGGSPGSSGGGPHIRTSPRRWTALTVAFALAAAGILGPAVTAAVAAETTSIWTGPVAPAGAVSSGGAVEVGLRWRSDVDGFVHGVRFWKDSANSGVHTGSLWTASGTQLASAVFVQESASGWQQVLFPTAVPVTAGTTYVASYHSASGAYSYTGGAFSAAGVDHAPLHALRDGQDGGNGAFGYGPAGTFPTNTYQSSNYWVDVAFSTSPPADTQPPAVTSISPADGATGVSTGTTVTATFTEALDPASVTASTVTLTGPGDAAVPAEVGYAAATKTVTLTPTAPLAVSTAYLVTIRGGSSGVKDLAGNAPATNQTWTFTTEAGPPCPCTIWTGPATPATSVQSGGAVELGVRFRTDLAGYVTGVRFWKDATDTGTHTASLWNNAGSPLAQAAATGETASGWQQVSFATAVPVAAGTTYVASYHSPSGGYSFTAGVFAAAGVDRPPLHALRNGVDGPNGVYAYAPASSFPTDTYQSSNYWVDVVFSTTPQVDQTPPTVTATTPADAADNVATTTPITATFSEPVDPGTVTGSTFRVLGPSDTPVPGAVAYDAATRTASFTPTAPLAVATAYRATVRGGDGDPVVKDAAGNRLSASVSWTFQTLTEFTDVPRDYVFYDDIMWLARSGITTGWQLPDGTRQFRPLDSVHRDAMAAFLYRMAGEPVFTPPAVSPFADVPTGRAFYKEITWLANAGVTSGWALPDGSREFRPLENVTRDAMAAMLYRYAGRPAFAPPAVSPFADVATDRAFYKEITWLASTGVTTGWTMPDGSRQFRPTENVARDAVAAFLHRYHNAGLPTPADTSPPLVTAITPAAGAVGVPRRTTVTATFDEALNAATVTTSTVTLTGPGDTPVPATVGYDGPSRTVTLTPTAQLAAGAEFTATVKGGPSGIKDLAGNHPTTNQSWSFTTTGPAAPTSIWPGPVAPEGSIAEGGAIEVGLTWRSDTAGTVTGVRFWKDASNTGVHTGSLWTASGTKLASAEFAAETASGWQQVSFATPVVVTAGTTYVVSYHSPEGSYSFTPGAFAAAGVDNPPLHALRDGLDGGNGVFGYAPSTSFPSSTYQSTNYWVDVLFTP